MGTEITLIKKLKEIYKKTKNGSIKWEIERPLIGQPYIYNDIIRIDKDNFCPVELRINFTKIKLSFWESRICLKIIKFVLNSDKKNTRESLIKQFLEHETEI